MAPKVCWADAIGVKKASAAVTIKRGRKDFEGDASTRKAGDRTFKPPVMEGTYSKRKYPDSRRFGQNIVNIP
jgi:hypothetical protein